jgi:hypothetical protein
VTVRVRFADMHSVTRSVTLDVPISATTTADNQSEEGAKDQGEGYPKIHARSQYPFANFVRKILLLWCTANKRSRTQFVKNFDQRGRNISLGRSFRKCDPLY